MFNLQKYLVTRGGVDHEHGLAGRGTRDDLFTRIDRSDLLFFRFSANHGVVHLGVIGHQLPIEECSLVIPPEAQPKRQHFFMRLMDLVEFDGYLRHGIQYVQQLERRTFYRFVPMPHDHIGVYGSIPGDHPQVQHFDFVFDGTVRTVPGPEHIAIFTH